jgi:hypothetical protein
MLLSENFLHHVLGANCQPSNTYVEPLDIAREIIPLFLSYRCYFSAQSAPLYANPTLSLLRSLQNGVSYYGRHGQFGI